MQMSSQPLVSVIMPVYNSSAFLGEAIDSILAQTFADFEFIIINDGSSDDSEVVILSYHDDRIRFIKNEKNEGLIYSLNKGLAEANGKYIARMDADDICLPERLEKQYTWLEQHPATAVAGCHISFINEVGKVTGEWQDDITTPTYHAIKKKIVWLNCIAHPSVMMRAEIIKNYQYQSNQKNAEDYDLWLTVLADGHVIEKVPEKLLLYRVHNTSITERILKKSNAYLIQFSCKQKFIAKRINNGKWGKFESKILLTTIYNGIMGIGKNIKRTIKN